MLIQTLLRRLVIIRTYAEQAVDAAHVVGLAHFNDSSCIVASTTHEERYASGHLLDNELLHLIMFLT